MVKRKRKCRRHTLKTTRKQKRHHPGSWKTELKERLVSVVPTFYSVITDIISEYLGTNFKGRTRINYRNLYLEGDVIGIFPNGDMIAAWQNQFEIRMLDSTKVFINTELVESLVVISSTHFVAVSEYNLSLWNLSGSLIQSICKPNSCLICSPNPNHVILADVVANKLYIWNLERGQDLEETTRLGILFNFIAPFRDDKVVVGGERLLIRNWKTGETQRLNYNYNGRISCLATLKDGKILIGSSNKLMYVWDADQDKLLFTLFTKHEPTEIFPMPDGRRVLVGTEYGEVMIWDCHTGICELFFKAHDSLITNLSILPDGRILTAGYKGQYRMWD